MRIGTQNFYDRSLFSLQTRQTQLDRAQEELATGKKVLKPSDDPVAANGIIKLKKEIDVSERYIEAQDTAKRFNEVEESNLDSMTNILFKIQSLLVQAENGSLDANSLNAIGIELDKRSEELFALSNAKNANGDYLYSGFQTKTAPYEKDIFGYSQYQGDNGQREVLIAASYPVEVNDPGSQFIDNVSSKYGYLLGTQGGANTGNLAVSIGVVSDSTEFSNPTLPASAFQITFITPTSYQVTDVQTGTVVTPARLFTPGDELSFQGVSVKTNSNTAPAAGDTFSFSPSSTTPEKSLHWVLNQAVEAMQINGTNYVAKPNIGSTVNVTGGNILRPEENKVADFDIILTPGAPATFQINEVDRKTIPATVLSTPVPAQTYNPLGTVIKFNGLDLNLSGPLGAADTIRLDRPENARRSNLLGDLQQELSNAMTNIDNIRSEVGARLNSIDNEGEAQVKFKEVASRNLATLEDIDVYEAVQNLQLATTGLQASQQAFAKVQNLTLFDYI